MTTHTHDAEHPPIGERQNEPAFLKMRAAGGRTLDAADRIRLMQSIGSVILALAAPVLALFWAQLSSALAVLAGLWLLVGRTWLKSLFQRRKLWGTRYQELFDTELFGLEWNTPVAGREEDVREEFRANESRWRVKECDPDWYEHIPSVPWPRDVLACQLQNHVYPRRNHRAYAHVLRTLFVLLCIALLALWIVEGFSLEEFVVRLFVPLIPVLLELRELPLQHEEAARQHGQQDEAVQELAQRHAEGDPITPAHCREIQDTIYESRLQDPPVSSLLHRSLKDRTDGASAARMEGLFPEFQQPGE